MGPAIWFVPHSDDETLSMGASIVQHVKAGRRCIVVLMTDGSMSGVRTRYPSVEEFVKERDRAFVAAVQALGGEPVIRYDRAVDASLSVAYAAGVMKEYAAKHPDASMKTMSPHDNHSDHRNLGIALQNLDFEDKRFYVKTSQWDEINLGGYSPTYDIKDALLEHAPVGWLSVRAEFEKQWDGAKSKVHT